MSLVSREVVRSCFGDVVIERLQEISGDNKCFVQFRDRPDAFTISWTQIKSAYDEYQHGHNGNALLIQVVNSRILNICGERAANVEDPTVAAHCQQELKHCCFLHNNLSRALNRQPLYD